MVLVAYGYVEERGGLGLKYKKTGYWCPFPQLLPHQAGSENLGNMPHAAIVSPCITSNHAASRADGSFVAVVGRGLGPELCGRLPPHVRADCDARQNAHPFRITLRCCGV